MGSHFPSEEFVLRVARLLGLRPVRWSPVGSGYTTAERWLVAFSDGSSAFVKAATNADTAAWLRTEQRLYAHLAGQDFLPRLLAWDDGEQQPLLVLEDLSGAHWPPPWQPEQIEQTLATLNRLHAIPPPADLPALKDVYNDLVSWRRVAAEPEAFLRLGFCTTAWLETALPTLIAAEAQVALDGDDLLHLDVRSDNLCFDKGRAVLVDWNWACRGNGLVDIAGWLPSLQMEGGPAPETILPDQPALAALFSGYWAYRAGLEPHYAGSRVRDVQRRQLQSALPWAARALDLPPPDGR